MRHLYEHEFHIVWNNLVEETDSQWMLQHIDSCEECRKKALKKDVKPSKETPVKMTVGDVTKEIKEVNEVWSILSDEDKESVRSHFDSYSKEQKELIKLAEENKKLKEEFEKVTKEKIKRTKEITKEKIDTTKETIKDTAFSIKAKAGEAKQAISRQTEKAKEAVKGALETVKKKTGESEQTVKKKVEDVK